MHPKIRTTSHMLEQTNWKKVRWAWITMEVNHLKFQEKNNNITQIIKANTRTRPNLSKPTRK